jgi:hypothetical protein
MQGTSRPCPDPPGVSCTESAGESTKRSNLRSRARPRRYRAPPADEGAARQRGTYSPTMGRRSSNSALSISPRAKRDDDQEDDRRHEHHHHERPEEHHPGPASAPHHAGAVPPSGRDFLRHRRQPDQSDGSAEPNRGFAHGALLGDIPARQRRPETGRKAQEGATTEKLRKRPPPGRGSVTERGLRGKSSLRAEIADSEPRRLRAGCRSGR